ncbi:MAG: tape measure protein [Pseudomonadota bacterium]|nr:tape measure protein [Pseudomonadota bacterium]
MPWDTPLADLQQQLSYLTEQERVIRRGAEAQAQRTQAEKDAIAASDALQKTQASGMTNQQKMNKALEEYARHIEKLKATNPASALLSPDAIARGEKAIRDQFSDKGKGSAGIKAVNKDLADQQRIYAELAGVSSTYYKELAAAQEQRAKGNVSEAQYVAYVNDLIQKQPFAVALAKEEAKAQQSLAKANLDAAASREKYITSLATGLDKIQADIAAQIEATERMGLSKEAIADLDAAKLEMLATDLELQAIKAMDRNLDQQTYDALKAQAQAYRELGIAKKGGAAKEAAIDLEKANAEAAKKAQEDWERASEQINNTLTDALLRGFEDGKGFASNFRDTLKNMFRTLVLRPIISFVVQPIGNLIQGAIGGLLGGGQGGAGSLLGTASNLNSAWGMLNGTGTGLSGIGYNMLAGLPGSVGYGMLPGMTVGSQQAAMLAAQTQAFGGAGLQATAGAAQTAQGASWMAGNAAGIAAVAATLIIGSLIERNARDRFSGAAYATSGGNDPFANTIAGSTGFDYLTGDLPDRAALLARLGELGAPMEAISDWNDRALLRLMESAAADNSEFGINWTSRVRDMRDTPDFYRGAGYAHPEELGWWHNKDNANLSTDPALIQASRDIALSIIGPLEGIGALIGDEAAYRATVGFANRGEGNGLWAGMNLQRDGQNVADWVNTDDFHSVGEAVRAMYSTALGTLDSFDLPGWADKQVTDARTALDALSGDKIGEQAAALYQQATGGISATFAAIEKMINLFPDFAEASQDAVYALGELTGGLDNLASAYGSYLSNFYSEEERRQLMFKELDSELDKLGIDTIPRTRAEFRELVSAQDLSTEAGREAFTVLMKLSGGFAEFVDAAESAADNARERIDSIFGQISKLWDEQISNWSKLSSEAESVFDAAIKAAKDLRGQVADTRQWDARAASVWIDQALAGLRATGALPDSKELADAIAAARGGLDMSQYDTLADMERDQLILAGKLKEIGDSAEVQMSFAEQQVQLLEQQRDYWRQQIDLLNATGETITSIDQGIEYLADYVREQTAIKAAEEAEKEASREAARRAAPSISPGGWGGGGWGGGG